MSERKHTNDKLISDCENIIADIVCSRCRQSQNKDACKTHGKKCREMYRQEATAIYEKHIQPLQEQLRFRYIIEWVLCIVIAILLVAGHCGDNRRHLLQDAINLFMETFSLENIRGQVETAIVVAEAEETAQQVVSVAERTIVTGQDRPVQVQMQPIPIRKSVRKDTIVRISLAPVSDRLNRVNLLLQSQDRKLQGRLDYLTSKRLMRLYNITAANPEAYFRVRYDAGRLIFDRQIPKEAIHGF